MIDLILNSFLPQNNGLIKYHYFFLSQYRAAINQLQDQICELQDEHAAEKGMRSMAKDECTRITASVDVYNNRQTEEVNKMQIKAYTMKQHCADLTKKVSKEVIYNFTVKNIIFMVYIGFSF